MAIDRAAPLLRMVWPDEATELDLEPLQGRWTEEQYQLLTDQTNRLIEFSDGVIEVLPMPTDTHQRMLGYLYRHLFALMGSVRGYCSVCSTARSSARASTARLICCCCSMQTIHGARTSSGSGPTL